MKILLSALFLSSFGAYASEISQQDFIKVMEANETALTKLEVGMTSKKVTLGDSSTSTCDDLGNCTSINCKYETTTESTVVSIYKKQHYIHVNQSTVDLTGTPECDFNDNESYLELKDNKMLDFNDVDFSNTTKIEKVSNNIYKMYSEYTDDGEVSNGVVTIDVTQSLFYVPLAYNHTSGWGNFSMTTSVEGYTDPKSFNLESIKLCQEYPLPNGEFGEACSEEDDYTEIIK